MQQKRIFCFVILIKTLYAAYMWCVSVYGVRSLRAMAWGAKQWYKEKNSLQILAEYCITFIVCVSVCVCV